MSTYGLEIYGELLKKYEGNDEEIVIPQGVTCIYDEAFLDCVNIKKIIVPDSVTQIGKKAFSNCSNLSYINIPTSVQSIGDKAFENCKSLVELDIPENTEIADLEIQKGCISLKKFKIPKGITNIPDKAFSGYRDLIEIQIPEGITMIGSDSFNNCISLQKIVLPNSVKYLCSRAFSSCTKLQEINIPNEVTDIRHELFKDCESLTKINLTRNISEINFSAFQGCQNLEEIIIDTINSNFVFEDGILFNKEKTELIGCLNCVVDYCVPKTVKHIKSNAFENCTNLVSVKIPSSVSYIGASAFKNCINLKNIEIEDGVEELWSNVFESCNSLESICIPNSVSSIGEGLFTNCGLLKNVKFSNSLEEIPYGTFENCTSLETFFVPDGIENVRGHAFYGCTSLKSINLNSIYGIDETSFEKCPNLKEIEFVKESSSFCFEDGVLYNKEKTKIIKFLNENKKISYRVPETVYRIGAYAFEDCENIETIISPIGFRYIEEGAFRNCSKLKNIPDIISDGYPIYIGEQAFKGCKNLEYVKIGYRNYDWECSSPIKIDEETFCDCTKLRTIEFSDEVVEILYNAFKGCVNLSNVIISENHPYFSVDEKGLYNKYKTNLIKAFNKEGASEYIVSDDVTEINEFAFDGSCNLESITIPPSVQKIGYGAFRNCNNLRNIILRLYITKEIYSNLFPTHTVDEPHNSYFCFEDNVLFTADKSELIVCLPSSKKTVYTIPNEVKKVYGYAFENCDSLETVVLSENITSLGDFTFKDCINLKTIEQKTPLEGIYTGAFYNSRQLKTILVSNEYCWISSDALEGCDVTPIGTDEVGMI